jgi:error-prone DNA polymerase
MGQCFPGLVYAEVAARTNFFLLGGTSHPAAIVAAAAALGHAEVGVADTNSLAGIVRAHVAAREVGIRCVVGARLVLEDGTEYLGRMNAPKGEYRLTYGQMIEYAGGWVLTMVPGEGEDTGARPRTDAATLRGRLALPLLVAAACITRDDERRRLDALVRAAHVAGAELLATNDVRYHAPEPGIERLQPVQQVVQPIRILGVCRRHDNAPEDDALGGEPP